jgi:very-short-patch-repair endonuclease
MDQHSDGRDTHRRSEAALADIAARQYSVFARSQALEVGITRGMIDRRVSTGRWLIDDYRVYRVAGAQECWEQRLMAACLAGPAVASHRAAGLLWDLPCMPGAIIEVTALRHRRRHAADVIWHESHHLTERDITEIEGIPCTRPVRTFLDLGVVLSPDELEQVLNEGIRRNLLSIPAICRRLEEFGLLRRGAKVVRAVLDRHVPSRRGPESVLETRFLQLVRSAGLPEPVPQFQVRSGDRVIARLDFAYVDRKIAIELDGVAYHNERRDRRRDNGVGALGWRVLRFDWDEVTRTPEYVLETIDAYLDQRSDGRDTHR